MTINTNATVPDDGKSGNRDNVGNDLKEFISNEATRAAQSLVLTHFKTLVWLERLWGFAAAIGLVLTIGGGVLITQFWGLPEKVRDDVRKQITDSKTEFSAQANANLGLVRQELDAVDQKFSAFDNSISATIDSRVAARIESLNALLYANVYQSQGLYAEALDNIYAFISYYPAPTLPESEKLNYVLQNLQGPMQGVFVNTLLGVLAYNTNTVESRFSGDALWRSFRQTRIFEQQIEKEGGRFLRDQLAWCYIKFEPLDSGILNNARALWIASLADTISDPQRASIYSNLFFLSVISKSDKDEEEYLERANDTQANTLPGDVYPSTVSTLWEKVFRLKKSIDLRQNYAEIVSGTKTRISNNKLMALRRNGVLNSAEALTNEIEKLIKQYAEAFVAEDWKFYLTHASSDILQNDVTRRNVLARFGWRESWRLSEIKKIRITNVLERRGVITIDAKINLKTIYQIYNASGNIVEGSNVQWDVVYDVGLNIEKSPLDKTAIRISRIAIVE